jgi:hypothetical protein
MFWLRALIPSLPGSRVIQTLSVVISTLNRPRSALQTRMILASRRSGRAMTLTEVFFLAWAIVSLLVVFVLLRFGRR